MSDQPAEHPWLWVVRSAHLQFTTLQHSQSAWLSLIVCTLRLCISIFYSPRRPRTPASCPRAAAAAGPGPPTHRASPAAAQPAALGSLPDVTSCAGSYAAATRAAHRRVQPAETAAMLQPLTSSSMFSSAYLPVAHPECRNIEHSMQKTAENSPQDLRPSRHWTAPTPQSRPPPGLCRSAPPPSQQAPLPAAQAGQGCRLQ